MQITGAGEAQYRAWLTEQNDLLDEPEIRRHEPTGSHAMELASSLADRLDRAVDLLRDDGRCSEARPKRSDPGAPCLTGYLTG